MKILRCALVVACLVISGRTATPAMAVAGPPRTSRQPVLRLLRLDGPAARRIVDGAVGRTRPVRVSAKALGAAREGRRVRLDLPSGAMVLGTVERRRARSGERFTISGRLDTVRGGTFILAVHRGTVVGLIDAGRHGTYALRPRPRGWMVLQRVDAAAALDCDVKNAPPPADDGGGGAGSGGCDDGSSIDLLVVYTPAARDQAGGTSAIVAQIDMMVEQVNTTYAASGIATSIELVHAQEVSYQEVNGNLVQLTDPDDGLLDEVHALRDAYGADVVTLVRSGAGGAAWGMSNLLPSFESSAFNEVGLSSSWYAVLAHEIGHNQGCCHAIGDGGCPPDGGLLYDFSSGHRFHGDSGSLYRTVMAYSPGTRIGRYSNPQVLYDGVPTGVAMEEPGEADNALTISSSAFTVANFRCHDSTCADLTLPSTGNDDCNGNGVPDACDIALGWSSDVDGDDVPDDCQAAQCPADFDGTRVVDILDMLALFAAWATGSPVHDIAPPGGDGMVGVADLEALLAAWGECP